MSAYGKAIWKVTFWSLGMAATVFLPVFLVGNMFVGAFLGLPVLERGMLYQASALLVFYVGLSVPVVTGVLPYALASTFAWTLLSKRGSRIAVLLLAPLVPLVPIMLRVPGWIVLHDFAVATVMATVAYGLGMAIVTSRSAARGAGRAAT